MTEDAGTEGPSRQRAMLLRLIEEHPGSSVTEIMPRVPFPWGVMSYHLRRLAEQGRILVIKEDPRTHRIYPVSAAPPGDAEASRPLALRGLSRSVLAYVAENPGCSFVDLVAAVDTSPRNVHYCLKRLLQTGLVQSDSVSRYRGLRATPEGTAALGGGAPPPAAKAPEDVPQDMPEDVPWDLLWRVMQAVRTAPSIAVATLRDLLRVPEPDVRRAVDALAKLNRVRVQDVDGTLRVWPA